MSMWWRKERAALHQRIAELERELHQRSPSPSPDLITALAEMTAKQASASAQLLSTVMEATETQAARALGRRSAAKASRDGQGRFQRKSADGAVKNGNACGFCRLGSAYYPFTLEERDAHISHGGTF